MSATGMPRTPARISVLAYVNRVRDLLGSPALPGSHFSARKQTMNIATSWDRLSARHRRLQASRLVADRWVMRVDDASTADRVAKELGQDWAGEPPEVTLPEALIDLAVAQHYDVVVEDEEGRVGGWWVPDGDGFPEFLTPEDLLVPSGPP